MPVPVRPFSGHDRRRLVAASLLVLALAAASASCTQHVDFKQALQVTDVSGGWYDFGIVDSKNKLVPSVTFRIRKPADVRLRSLSLNVHFKKIVDASKPGKDGEAEFDEVFLQTVEFTEGTQTALMTVRPQTGFTGDAPQTRAEMLQHRLFQDIRVRVFAKESSTTWVELLAFDVPRTVLTK
jgi:hypothetical protein